MSVLIYLIPAALFLGLLGLAGFLWALKNGQFADQARARYLPLVEDVPLPPAEVSRRLPVEVYALIIIITLGMLSIASTITLTIYWLKG